jgi:hypothetical protein
MIKYKTGGYGKEKIEAIKAIKETAKQLVIEVTDGGGKARQVRTAKRSGYDNYFDTWEEAHAFLLDQSGRRLKAARRALESAQGEYGNIKGMKSTGHPND